MSFNLDSIGFIGLGVMGLPMATNLARGFPDAKIHVYDISTECMNKLTEALPNGQVVICGSSAEVARSANVIISIVPEGAHVRQVYLDQENGVITTDLAGKLLLDCSTIDTATSRDVSTAIKAKYPTASFYDAPISGGSLGAEKGTLTFMVGINHSDEDDDRDRDQDPNWPTISHILGKMGKSIFPCGGPTMGLTAKLSNNYCSALIALATSEAMNIGMRSGMDPRVLAHIFSTSTAQSTICDKWCPVPRVVPDAPSSHGYRGGFKVQLMKKDFGLAMEAARAVDARTYLGDVGLQVYEAAAGDERCRDLDSRVVFRWIGGDEEWDGGKTGSPSVTR